MPLALHSAESRQCSQCNARNERVTILVFQGDDRNGKSGSQNAQVDTIPRIHAAFTQLCGICYKDERLNTAARNAYYFGCRSNCGQEWVEFSMQSQHATCAAITGGTECGEKKNRSAPTNNE